DHGRIPEPRRGVLLIASCASGSYMARRVVEKYRQLLAEAGSCDQVLFLENVDTRFSDSETLVRLSRHVGGYDVFLFQALSNPNTPSPVDQNYMAFLIAARAFREHGAKHVTGVLPYLAYARQDKPTKFMREPTTAKLMADLGTTAGIDRLIVWDPHSAQIHGFYGKTPVAMLDSLALFVNQFRHFEGRDDVIVVAPDAGASKFVTHFSRVLGIRSAIASKFRPHPEEVTVSDIIGDFRGKKIAVVLDDMISSAGTIYEVIKKLVVEKRVQEVYLGVSHNLCVGKARERLSELNSEYNLKEVVITNSIPQTEEFKNLPFVTVKCLSDSLSRTINRIHYDRSVSEVFNVGEKE
ncbi:MAG: ribose-phosphate diphosphokinase, partial [Spirochaetota bacterium]